MEKELYLLWSPQGWGVFDSCSCPDPFGFPDYCYRMYIVDEKDEEKVFGALMKRQEELAVGNILPTRDTQEEIFPELSDIL